MNQKTYRVLFLCKDNAGRSLMAESMLNKLGHGRFSAYSAGSDPVAEPHPIAMQMLEQEGYDTSNLSPKHWQSFFSEDAPKMDLIFTLCEDSKADARLDTQLQQVYDRPVHAHWHFAEPHVLSTADNNTDTAAVTEHHNYSHVQRELAQRLRLLINLPDDKIEHLAGQ